MAEEEKQKPVDEFDKVFDGQNQNEPIEKEEIGDVNKGKIRFLLNVGQPSIIKVNMQEAIEWYDDNMRKIKIEVVTNDQDDKKMILKRRQYGLTIGDWQKAYLYFYDGKFKKSVLVDGGHTFSTLSYPHIIDFKCGQNLRNQRAYDFPVEKVVRVDNSDDADILLERFSFLIETDEGGNYDPRKIVYLRDLKQRPLKKSEMAGVDYPDPQKVGFEEFRPHQPDAEPVKLVVVDNKAEVE